MRVWVLKNGEPWPLDSGNRLMRTGQLAEALRERGHCVTWWTGNVEHSSKAVRQAGEWRRGEDFDVIALPGMPYDRNISLRRYVNYRQVAARFARAARKREAPDLLVAALPCHHFALAGMEYARRFGVAAVIDHRDLWPDIFHSALPPFLPDLLLAGEHRVQRAAFRMADAIVGISPGYVEAGLRHAGRSRTQWDRHFHLGAFPPVAQSRRSTVDALAPYRGKKLLIYVGTFGYSYELPLVLEAARDLASRRRDFIVLLCGRGDQQLDALLADHPAAVSLGWLDGPALAPVLACCHAGLMPFRAGSPQSIPNKAFDYFSAGLPVISSLAGEMQRLIEGRGLGLHYPAGDRNALRQAMEAMIDATDAWNLWSANAWRFFAEEGDSTIVYVEYARHLERLVEHRKQQAAARGRNRQ